MKYIVLSLLALAWVWVVVGCGDDNPTQPPGGEAPPRFVKAWFASTAPGSPPPPLGALPIGIATAQNGDVYVIEGARDRILRYDSTGVFREWKNVRSDADSTIVRPLAELADPNPLSPTYVALDSQDEIYVTKGDSIKKFRLDLAFGGGDSLVFVGGWGGTGSGQGQFLGARGIVVDSQDNVYVYDAGNYRVQKFTTAGSFITEWGSPGAGDGQFGNSEVGFDGGIAVDSLGFVYVADAGNVRVQVFGGDGAFIRQFGGQFVSLAGITVDDAGAVYVVDPEQSSVQKYRAEGVFVSRWGSWCPSLGASSACDGDFAWPAGVVAASGNLFSTELINRRIQKFTYNAAP